MEKIIEGNLIEVQMAQMVISQAPSVLVTKGLGSCLGITFFDPFRKIGAMAHPMLPDFSKSRAQVNPNRYVNSVIKSTLEELKNKGCSSSRLEIKIFGGAHMFRCINTDSVLNVGQRNTEIAWAVFKELGLNILGQEVGGTFGRTIFLNLETGKVLIKTISWGEKEV